MTIGITIFKTGSGRITGRVECPQSAVWSQVQNGENWVAGSANDLTQYVSGGLITDRPQMSGTLNKTTITANGTDLATIANLPQPCTATFAGKQYEVMDGSFEFTVDTPGSYTVKVEAFPHLPAEFTVEAT
jgi:hypothetical protein